jgi:hypothetical protein
MTENPYEAPKGEIATTGRCAKSPTLLPSAVIIVTYWALISLLGWLVAFLATFLAG